MCWCVCVGVRRLRRGAGSVAAAGAAFEETATETGAPPTQLTADDPTGQQQRCRIWPGPGHPARRSVPTASRPEETLWKPCWNCIWLCRMLDKWTYVSVCQTAPRSTVLGSNPAVCIGSGPVGAPQRSRSTVIWLKEEDGLSCRDGSMAQRYLTGVSATCCVNGIGSDSISV